MYDLLLLGIPFVLGAILGYMIPGRFRVFRFLPAVAIGLTYWIAVGWYGDDYDIGRGGLILLSGAFAVLFAGVWTMGAAVGAAGQRRVRRAA